MGGDISSQVPTALIITSSESASSIETQFFSLTDLLKEKHNVVPLYLDEKKCGKLKSAIEHIWLKLEAALNPNGENQHMDRNGFARWEEAKGEDSGDDLMIRPDPDQSSNSDDSDSDENDQNGDV